MRHSKQNKYIGLWVTILAGTATLAKITTYRSVADPVKIACPTFFHNFDRKFVSGDHSGDRFGIAAFVMLKSIFLAYANVKQRDDQKRGL